MNFRRIINKPVSEAQFIDLSAVTKKKVLDERELLRAIRMGLAAEEEAVHLYELIADSTKNEKVKRVMQSVADEEKVHVGEFQKLLKDLDPNEEKLLKDGEEEAEEE
jgi:rubrerythrin